MSSISFNPDLFKFNANKRYVWQVFDKVTIATITFDRLSYTKKLFDSLFKYTNLPHDLLIIDNGSCDGTREYLKYTSKENQNIKIIFNKRNIGKIRALSQIKNNVSDGLLVYFDNDIELLSDYWLLHVQKAYHAIRLEFGHCNWALGIRLINAEEYGFRYSFAKKILKIPTSKNTLPRTSFAAASKESSVDAYLDEEIVIGLTSFLMGGVIICPMNAFRNLQFEKTYPKYLGGEDGFISDELQKAGISLGYIENGPIARHNDWPYSEEKIKLYTKLTKERAVTDYSYVKWKIFNFLKCLKNK